MAYVRCRSNRKNQYEPILLWENPNPNVAFANNTVINIDMHNYSYFIIYHKSQINSDILIRDMFIVTDATTYPTFTVSYNSSTSTSASAKRRMYKFDKSAETLTASTSDDTKYLIPYKIYGIKNSFEKQLISYN